MSSAPWTEVRAVLEEALDRAPPEREALVRERCGADSDLASEALRLLALDREPCDSGHAQQLERGALYHILQRISASVPVER